MSVFLIVFPLVSVFVLNLPENKEKVTEIFFISVVIEFVVSLVMWLDVTVSVVSPNLKVSGHSVFLEIDGLSQSYIVLTTFIIPISVVSNWSWRHVESNYTFYISCFLVLESFLIIIFSTSDLFVFYLFFEGILVPVYFIVGIWGSSKYKIRSIFLFFLYSFFGSLFMLVSVLGVYIIEGSSNLNILQYQNLEFSVERYVWLGFFISLGIKTPVYPVHLWLPETHSEAPLGGSIVLSSIILKISTYGYIRILVGIWPESSEYYVPLIQTISVVTIIYSSIITIRQIDSKCVIAYSSINHMGICLLGVFSNSLEGLEGGILLSLGHGLVSPALFILVGGVLYDRYHTRIIKYYRGVTSHMPLFSLSYFFFTLCNIGTPLTVNWSGEIFCFLGSYLKSPVITIVSSLSIVFSVMYSIWLYNRISFGSNSNYLITASDITRQEFNLMFPLFIFSYMFGVFPNIILRNLHWPIGFLLYYNSPPNSV